MQNILIIPDADNLEKPDKAFGTFVINMKSENSDKHVNIIFVTGSFYYFYYGFDHY